MPSPLRKVPCFQLYGRHCNPSLDPLAHLKQNWKSVSVTMDVRMPWMAGCLFSCPTIARIALSSTRLLSSVHFNMRATMSLSPVWPSSFLSYVYPIHSSFYQLMFHLLLVFNIHPCCPIFVGHLDWFADPSFARTVVLFCDSRVYSPPFGQYYIFHSIQNVIIFKSLGFSFPLLPIKFYLILSSVLFCICDHIFQFLSR
jgi:hypothetical protein